MIVNKYGNGGSGSGSTYVLPIASFKTLGGIKVGEGLSMDPTTGLLSASGGSIDSGAVQTQIDETLDTFKGELEDGEPIVGMARQLYSPDGVDSKGLYAYRTTAGDEDVETGDAKLLRIEGNAVYPEQKFDPSGELLRNDEPVEGFDMVCAWGQLGEWESDSVLDTAEKIRDANPKKFRTDASGLTSCRISIRQTGTLSNYATFSFKKVNGELTPENYNGMVISATPVSGVYEWRWSIYNASITLSGTVVNDGNITISIDYDNTPVGAYIYDFVNTEGPVGLYTNEWYVGVEIPFDIPLGASSYVYDAATTAWTPSLPQAISSMTVNGDTYVPEDGDSLGIFCLPYADEPASYPKPLSFFALGLNSFTSRGSVLNSNVKDKRVQYDSSEDDGHYTVFYDVSDKTYFVRAVPGLADGYIVHSPNGHLPYRAGVATDSNFDGETEFEFGTTVELSGSTTYVVYPTNEMPYIAFSINTDDVEDICVHPRWSGTKDDAFEEYEVSQIYFDSIFLDDMALVSIGDVRNVFDIENQKFIWNIGVDDYDEGIIQDFVDEGKVLGEDYVVDDNYVYYVLDEPEEDYFADTIGDFSGDYYANDFSVEYFVENNPDCDCDMLLATPVYAETFYITNLVDKLRRMQNYFVHLDNLDANGETGMTYEYNGALMTWNPNSGYVGNWLRALESIEQDEGTGFKFAYIPDGQVLFDYKYQYGGDWRTVKYSGGTLYCLETGGTVVTAVTVGNQFVFQASQYGGTYNIYGKYEKGWIGFSRKNYMSFQNMWDGSVNVGHYELIDKSNCPYLGPSNSDVYIGIPKFNGRGQVVRNAGGVSTKDIQFNTDASQYGTTGKITFYTNGTNNGPARIFAPTAGGTAGQVLTSAGSGSEPQWSTMIKAVKITSDAYEALSTKDPNTLYLIDDE